MQQQAAAQARAAWGKLMVRRQPASRWAGYLGPRARPQGRWARSRGRHILGERSRGERGPRWCWSSGAPNTSSRYPAPSLIPPHFLTVPTPNASSKYPPPCARPLPTRVSSREWVRADSGLRSSRNVLRSRRSVACGAGVGSRAKSRELLHGRSVGRKRAEIVGSFIWSRSAWAGAVVWVIGARGFRSI